MLACSALHISCKFQRQPQIHYQGCPFFWGIWVTLARLTAHANSPPGPRLDQSLCYQRLRRTILCSVCSRTWPGPLRLPAGPNVGRPWIIALSASNLRNCRTHDHTAQATLIAGPSRPFSSSLRHLGSPHWLPARYEPRSVEVLSATVTAVNHTQLPAVAFAVVSSWVSPEVILRSGRLQLAESPFGSPLRASDHPPPGKIFSCSELPLY